ncbi:hypothetical protein CXF85_20195 [Colwellia sp. 75C3]|nr:hypothetical protein CXF85_20195 [Colwellia sp. 75C3]
MPCSSCHTAFPQLNQFGRNFKEAGYRIDGIKNDFILSPRFSLDKSMPISAVLVARPYDKKESGDKKVRAIHEVELIFAANITNDWSIFFELEAEDETNFEPVIPLAVLTYNYSKAINLQFSYGDMFFSDPYGFLGDHFRMTRGHVKVIDEAFGGADNGGKLRSARQNVSTYGRVFERLFYSVALSGGSDDTEGEDANIWSGRLAFDVTDQLMIGGLIVDGTEAESNRGFSRIGIDAQFDYEQLRIQGAFINATDDDIDMSEQDNIAYSIQAMYRLVTSNNDQWVPLIRLDNFEKNDGNDGNDEYTELTANLSWYFSENSKVYLEYWKQLDVPTTKDEDSRLTLQAVVVF